MNFNEKLREFRAEHDYTQEDFAKITGLARSTIAELESGRKKVTLKAIEKIANKTNTNLSTWVTNDYDIKPFDGLLMVLEALKKTGDIDCDGNMNDKAKKLSMKMLEKETKLLYYNQKKD
ncbi:helix-turn-helix transcriptional regulator [Clostridium estertheticum]|uniref:helix-turn-helix domain-containing protein n=1 Tax=Clostridium estertheticum TaxID=238834 RepID=UPI001CF3BF88|nr:helix-turn-helix transcriptional regulator [Clostridium estertheticum]MCB2308871.1 helix-turn-helix transcriptional regulator [Clostridium estertheticum]MCB2347283.1 helix-turn-helix transcriptional regulator [Clostridium estertheticum]MCB2351950.1 helix-turn-helix transcriptional regulator [Clostridium estertheticum]WAG48486.1 helix-turn-helix transcriptional regulator [Clostridium estertheticum]